MPQADDLIERAKEIYLPTGAEWRAYDRTFTFRGGGRVRFRPLENTSDAQRFQGQNVSHIAVEEAGNYPDPRAIDMLFGALRSKAGVPVQMILTANPGGPGHQWIKHRYIDPAPMGLKPLRRKLDNGEMSHEYCYIPSRVQDNQLLLQADPGYIQRLHLVGSPELVRAWLQGDWTVTLGAYFPEFSLDRHVVAPIELPAHWHRFRAMDWGSARPFSVGWYAVATGDVLPQFPRGSLLRYREWCGSTGQPNVGLKLTAEEVAAGILQREQNDMPSDRRMIGYLDPAAFAQDGGPSLAERMARVGCHFVAADNKRIGDLGRAGGWDEVRSRLRGDGEKPALLIFSTCKDLIRTLPALQHDRSRPEDVDTEAEDHAADELRYACMSRPYVRDAPVEKPKSDRWTSSGKRRAGYSHGPWTY
jgi:hypothetical protein